MTAPDQSPIEKAAAFGKIQVAIQTEILAAAQELIRGQLTQEMLTFLKQLARTLSGLFSIPSQERQLAAKGSFHPFTKQYWKGYGSDEDDKYRQKFKEARHLSSYVKDVQEVWVKDTIMNFGLGLLKSQDWQIVQQILNTRAVRARLSSIEQDDNVMRDMKEQYPEAFKKERGIGAKMIEAVNQITRQIQSNNLTREDTDVSRLNLGPRQQPSFLSHDPQYIGVRQDTYLPGDKVKLPNSDQRAHVLETRRNIDSFIDKIGTLNTSYAPLAPLASIVVTGNPTQDKTELRKRYPVDSFIQYRVANVDYHGNIDINCIAKVRGYRGTTLGSSYQLVVRGIEFVDAKTLQLIHNDPYNYTPKYIPSDTFNVEQQARTHLRQIHTIEQSDVLT
ncbi:MAG: hypothetical protein F6K10_25015 [Moorea sp. SIO2B7]|nr:hypothetical protein [Moorena sp. SIO2B7]